jgi:hemerythrin-like domain-containing protein
MNSEQYADIREMYMAHAMFRREFGLLPALIRGTEAGDVARAQVIAHHSELIELVIRHHHHAEDVFLWPKLISRAAQDSAPVIAAMEAQHGELDKVIDTFTERLQGWRETADSAQGAVLAETADQLRQLLSVHMTGEEEQALPLIAKYVTAAEWAEMVAASSADLAPEQMPLLFGMMMYEGDPDVIADAIDHMPPEVRAIVPGLAKDAFARHAQLVYGTSAPARGDEL